MSSNSTKRVRFQDDKQIPVVDMRGNTVQVACRPEDYDMLIQFIWGLDVNGIPVTFRNGRMVTMQYIIKQMRQ